MPTIETPHSICRFGIARRDITPPVGIYHRMWGAAAHDRSADVHRPLTATAMVFRSDRNQDEEQVVVALDHCLLFDSEMQTLLDHVAERSGIGRDHIVVTFSHTHAAGLMDPRRADMPGGDLIRPYLDELATRVADAVQEASAAVVPVAIQYAADRCALAAHRDFWDEANQLFACGTNPEVEADDTLVVARIVDQTNRMLATVVNYACHPTTLAWDNQSISPDYPGAMREVVEQATGAPCVFLLGASGDLGPRDGFVGDTKVADRNGRQLGYAALAALESLPPARTKMRYAGPVISGATIGVWQHDALGAAELEPKSGWHAHRLTVDLPYRTDLQSAEETARQLKHWTEKEQKARDAGDDRTAADARAMAERMRRWKTRFAALPPGDNFPFPVTLWRMGDSWWLAVEGEPYNLLQTALRERFPGTPIVVMVLANGSRAWYLPTAETYGKGIYQESMANLAAGCLEQLIKTIGDAMERLM